MKKLFFLFAFMGLFAFASTAQTKACCASKSASSKACSATMDKAASADQSIVKQVSNSGEVNYVRKEVCPHSGKVTLASVEYCTKSGKFINVSPGDAEKKASCTKSASATKVSDTGKKACCAEGEMKACCSKKSGKAATKVSTKEAKVKLVSDKQNQ